MAVNLLKPSDDDGLGYEGPLADVVELHPAEAAAVRSRLRRWWDLELESQTLPVSGPRVMALPRLLPYVWPAGAVRTVWAGYRVMWRAARRLPPAGTTAAPAAPPAPAAGRKGVKAKVTARRKTKTKKKTETKAPARTGLGWGLGEVFAAIVGAGFVWQIIRMNAVPIGYGLLIGFAVMTPVAWIVGAMTTPGEPVIEVPAGVEDDQPQDGAGESGETEDQAPDPDPVEGPGEYSPEEEQQAVYEWIRNLMGDGNVHTRTLLEDLNKQPGKEGVTMAQMKARLSARGITFRDGVRAPTSDPSGGKKNRPGIHRDDIPWTHTPYRVPGTSETRLLPRLQGSDLQ